MVRMKPGMTAVDLPVGVKMPQIITISAMTGEIAKLLHFFTSAHIFTVNSVGYSVW